VNETASPTSQQTATAKPGAFERAYALFAALPRVGKWIVAALALLLFSQVFQYVVRPITDDLDKRADRAAKLLAGASGRAEKLPDDVARRAVVFGPNAVPGRDVSEKERFSNAIAAIMKKHGVSDAYGFDARPLALSGDVLPRVAARFGGSMARTAAELKFSGSPETVSKVIADIDSSPFVDAITDVRLTYKDRRVSAVLSIERWGVSVKGGAS
jgi:hypothetical protein